MACHHIASVTCSECEAMMRRSGVPQVVYSTPCIQCDELRAENERLKMGLKVIAQLEPVCGDSDSNWSKLERAAELARKALREAGGE